MTIISIHIISIYIPNPTNMPIPIPISNLHAHPQPMPTHFPTLSQPSPCLPKKCNDGFMIIIFQIHRTMYYSRGCRPLAAASPPLRLTLTLFCRKIGNQLFC